MSYAFSPRSACMACKIITWFHCSHGLLKLVIHYLAKQDAAPASFSWSQRPTVHAFLQKDALELFGSGCTPSVVHERLTGKAQSAQLLRALGRP